MTELLPDDPAIVAARQILGELPADRVLGLAAARTPIPAPIAALLVQILEGVALDKVVVLIVRDREATQDQEELAAALVADGKIVRS